MKTSSRATRAAIPLLFGIFLIFLTVKNSEIAANGIKNGLSLATNVLIPSLLPFLVLSELLLSLGVGEAAAGLLARPARLLFGLSPRGTVALLLGWLCGVPVGTVSAAMLLKNGDISKEELQRLLLLCNTPSTGFLIGAVGCSLFGSREVGTVLFFAVLLAAALTGFLFKLAYGNLPILQKKAANGAKNALSATTFTAAVRHGFSTALQVTGFVLFFSAVTECVRAVGILSPILKVTLCGLLEMTSGTVAAAALLPPDTALLLCAFFAGFSGLSICLQVFSLAECHRPKLVPYLLAKLTQGVLAAALVGIYVKLRDPKLSASTAAGALGSITHGAPRGALIALFTFFLVFVLLPLLAHVRLVTFYKKED